MKKILDKIKAYFKERKFLTLILLFSFIYVGFKFLYSTSNQRKIEESIQKNKIVKVLADFQKVQDKIEKVSIIKYGSVDKYYTEIKGMDGTLDKIFSKEDSLKIQKEFLTAFKIPTKIVEASSFDMFYYYIFSPIKESFAELLSNTMGIVMLVFFIISIVVIRGQMGAKKKKYQIAMPEDIKGSLDDLIGMEDIKSELKTIESMYQNRLQFKEYGLDKTFNLMLSGPAGTGKTKIAGYLSKMFNMPIIFGSAAGLETGLVGGGSNVIRSIYEEAQKLNRCIVFLDEAEILFQKRGSHPHQKHSDDTPNMFLSLLDGISTNTDKEIIWIVASNFNEVSSNMDEAMLRRFPIKLDFRLPNKVEREEIYKMYLSKINQQYVDIIDFKYISEVSTGLSPAHIQMVVERAAMTCANNKEKITTKHLYESFEKSTIGLTNRETTAHAQEKRKLIGIHELGHFVIQLDRLMKKYGHNWTEIKENMAMLKISTESVAKQGALGYVLSKQEEVSLNTLDDLEYKIKQLYGGVAAEQVFEGSRNITTGSSNDIEKATNILKSMIFNLGMYSNSKINYQIINNNSKNDELMKLMETKSEEFFKDAESMIKEYKPLIEYLNPILLENYVLQSDEILKHIEDFYSTRRQ